jgi:hypothetical protein
MLKKLVVCAILALSAAAATVSADFPPPTCTPPGNDCVVTYR